MTDPHTQLEAARERVKELEAEMGKQVEHNRLLIRLAKGGRIQVNEHGKWVPQKLSVAIAKECEFAMEAARAALAGKQP